MKKSNLPKSIFENKEDLKQFYRVGADFALNYKKEQNLTQAILDATEGKGVDIILDCIGAQWAKMVKIIFSPNLSLFSFEKNVQVAAVDARWVLYGLLSGSEVEKFDLKALMFKRISVIPSTLRSRSKEYKAELIRRFKAVVLPHLENGDLKVYVDTVFKVDWTDVKPVSLIIGSDNYIFV